MNRSTLIELFSQTYNPDGNVRKAAEQRIVDLENFTGFLPALLELVVDKTENISIRKACAIFLKNSIEKNWEEGQLSEEDRTRLREQLFPAFCQAEPSLYSYFTGCIGSLLHDEFPGKLPLLLSQIKAALGSGEISYFHPGLLVLLQIIRKKKNRSRLSEEIDCEIDDEFLPLLVEKGRALLDEKSEIAAAILKGILKAYHSNIEFALPATLQVEESLQAWMSLFFAILEAPISAAEDADDSMNWKPTKWAWKILDVFVRKYGISSLKSFGGKKYDSFASMFEARIAGPLVQQTLRCAAQHASGEKKCPPRVYNLLCNQFVHYVKSDPIWESIRPNLSFIITGLIFPHLCFSQEARELWENEPLEYVRTNLLDTMYDTYTMEEGAAYLLEKMVQARKSEIIQPLLELLGQIFSQVGTAASEEDAYKKDGALNVVSTVAHILFKENQEEQLRQVALSVCVPELSSPFAFLKCRACEVLEATVDQISLNDEQGVEILRRLVPCLGPSEHVAVRVKAISAAVSLVSNEGARAEMAQHLPLIVQTLIDLTNQTVSETLPSQLETLLRTFQAALVPYLAQIAAHLAASIKGAIEANAQLYGETGTYYIENVERYMAIQAMFRAFDTLLEMVKMSPEMLSYAEKAVFPVLAFIFEQRIEDLYSDAVGAIEALLYYRKDVSEQLWSLLPALLKIFKDSPPEYATDFGTTFDNYLSYGTALVSQTPQLRQEFFQLIQTYLTHEEHYEDEMTYGCLLMESFMLRYRGQIDDLAPVFMEMVLPLLFQKDDLSDTSYVLFLETLINALLYNPLLALQKFASLEKKELFFLKWAQHIEGFTRVHDKKITLIALGTLLSTPQALELAETNLGEIATLLHKTLQTLPAALEKRKKLLEGGAESSEYDSDCYNSDEDIEEDDDSWYDDELEEEPYLETPLDDIDAIEFTKAAMATFEKNSPATAARFKELLPK